MWALLAVLCLALFLDGLDYTMAAVSLPSIGSELGMSTAELQWIMNGYILGFGGFLLLGGRTADLLGRRNVFLVALAVFAVASLLGGLVDDSLLLIVTRFIKGVAAAFTAPTGLSIITTTFAEGRQRNRALSIYTVFGASGFSSGLIFGGLMTGIDWRWTFLFPVPIALVALIVGIALVPKDRPAASGGYDFLGAVTLTGAMLMLVYTVVTAPEIGWLHVRTLVGFAVAVVLLAVFVIVERKIKYPLVRLGILANGALVRANLSFIALLGSYAAFQFVVTLYFQRSLAWSPLEMALAVLPVGMLVVLAAPYAGKLIGRYGTPPVIIGGLLSLSLGQLLFLRLDSTPNYVLDILPTTILVGIGFALTFPSASVQATAGVADHEQGLAAGLLQTSGQVGSAIVLAVTTAIIASSGSSDPASVEASADVVLAQFRPGLIFGTVIALVGLAITLIALLRARSRAAR